MLSWEQPVPPETQPQDEPADDVTFLQLSIQQFSDDKSDLKAPPIELASVWKLQEELDAHYFLPCFDLPRPSAWHPACYDWLDLRWWEFSEPAFDLWVYYDGSFFKGDNQRAGGAVVAFVATEYDWCFAGALSTALPKARSSYQAELWTKIVALKFAFDLLKTARSTQGWFPSLHLCFDAQTVGKQADGTWTINALPREGTRARSLFQWLETLIGQPIDSRRIPGHVGEPGNEMVDHLAKLAADGKGSHDIQPWLDDLFSREWDHAFPWLWATTCTQETITQRCKQHNTPAQHPFSSPSTNCPSLNEEGKLQARFGTCNVLTLKQQGTTQQEVGANTPSRLSYLLKQAKDAKLTSLAMQETRIRRSQHGHTEDFFLFRSSSTDRGHYGMLLAFARNRAIGHVTANTRQQTIFFEESDFAIITARPRILIVRVHNSLMRAIVVNAHAPHTGAAKTDIDDFWHEVTQAIPPKYARWDVILLTDANARVGSEPNDNIGSFQAESQDEKSEGFCTFIHDQGLFIPATFAEFQIGSGGTWRHSGGTWHRNDYVALPVHWNFTGCQAWVDEDIDPSLLKDDHKAAVVECTCQLQPFGRTRPIVQPKLFPQDVFGQNCVNRQHSWRNLMPLTMQSNLNRSWLTPCDLFTNEHHRNRGKTRSLLALGTQFVKRKFGESTSRMPRTCRIVQPCNSFSLSGPTAPRRRHLLLSRHQCRHSCRSKFENLTT